MFARIGKNIELKFWDVMIPLLSNSACLRKTVGRVSKVWHGEEKRTRYIMLALGIALTGFICGFLIFSLNVILS